VLNVKPTDIAQLLTYSRPMLERALGEQNTLTVALPNDRVTVLVDASQLEQALINLLVNAKHAMPDGGNVAVHVHRLDLDTHPDWPEVRAGVYVRISVADTGSGMDEATRHRVFDPFFTTKGLGHGTGLGLSIVHGIVEQAGGHIRVTSEPGRGACFEMLLPFHKAAASEPPRDLVPVEWTAGSGVVLVVEDQPQVQRATKRILTAAGYHVLSAVDGEDALRISSAHDGPIDALVTDVIMPGLSGVELSRRLLKQNPDLAVLLVSGYAGKEITELAELGPDVQFLQKPFDAASLTSTVAATLKLKGKGGT
jgi:CheY-like chemotaxis protein/anti-sigma regulatory factor (Ser/Thr protein kinase)